MTGQTIRVCIKLLNWIHSFCFISSESIIWNIIKKHFSHPKPIFTKFNFSILHITSTIKWHWTCTYIHITFCNLDRFPWLFLRLTSSYLKIGTWAFLLITHTIKLNKINIYKWNTEHRHQLQTNTRSVAHSSSLVYMTSWVSFGKQNQLLPRGTRRPRHFEALHKITYP